MKFNMTKLSVTLILSVMLAFMQSCTSGGDNDICAMVKTEKKGSWGMIDASGKTVFADEFKDCPTIIGKGLLAAPEGEGFVFYTISEKPKELKGGELYKNFGFFYESDIAPVVIKGQRISVIDTKGDTKFMISPIDGKEIIGSASAYSKGLLIVVNEDHQVGAIDANGKVVVKCKYKFIAPFLKDNTVAVKDDDRFVVINTKGEEILKIKDDYSLKYVTEYGVLLESNEGRFSFLTLKGDYEKLPAAVSNVYEFNTKYVVYRKTDAEVGVMTRSGDVVVRPKYTRINLVGESDNFLVCHNDKYRLIDKDDNEIVSFDDYKNVGVYNGKDMTFIAYDGSEYILLSKDGKPLDKQGYIEIYYQTLAGNAFSRGIESDYTPEPEPQPVAEEAVEPIDDTVEVVVEDVPVTNDSSAASAQAAAEAAPAASSGAVDYTDLVTSKKLTQADISGYSKKERRLMRNTIYARHGRIFKSKDLQQYFSQFDWYVPQYNEIPANRMTEIELYNINFLQKNEK